MYKCSVEKLENPVNGFLYNARVLASVDGGKSWYYAGCGKMCKTLSQARRFCDRHIIGKSA